MSPTGWLGAERAQLASEQILDAAGSLFAERGVTSVGMAEVAERAGCSRATLYRYFDNREALRTAFVHRETRRIGAAVAESVRGVHDPGTRLVEVMSTSLRLVRAEPTLVAWFSDRDAGVTTRLAQSSEVIEALVMGELGGDGSHEVRRRARWVVRVLVSLLAEPGADEAEERRMIEDFVVPVVT